MCTLTSTRDVSTYHVGRFHGTNKLRGLLVISVSWKTYVIDRHLQRQVLALVQSCDLIRLAENVLCACVRVCVCVMSLCACVRRTNSWGVNLYVNDIIMFSSHLCFNVWTIYAIYDPLFYPCECWQLISTCEAGSWHTTYCCKLVGRYQQEKRSLRTWIYQVTKLW